MATPIQEAQWVLRAQCDDRDALEMLLRSVQPALRRYIAGFVGSDEAEDILQDVLVLVSRKLYWLEQPELFRAWAFRIASRAAFRHLKKRRRWSESMLDEAALEDVAAPGVPGERVRALLDSADLSPASRAVLVLHFQEEMPLAHVAAVLELPIGTVKSRLAFGPFRIDEGRSVEAPHPDRDRRPVHHRPVPVRLPPGAYPSGR